MKVYQSEGFNSKQPVYIGIDQSYSGFAITALNDGYKTTVFKSDKRGVDRLSEIHVHLIDELLGYDIKDIAIEGYAFGSQMANMLGELGGMVKLTLRDTFGIYPLIVPPTVLKKYATGKGQGISKSQILMNVYKKWQIEYPDDNAADSFILAHIVSGEYNLAYEKEVYDKLQDVKFRER
mgnify:FL=1